MEQPLRVPPKDREQNAEAKIKSIVAKADLVFSRVGEFREPGSRWGSCGFATDLIRRAAEREGVQASTYQVMDIHGNGGLADSFQHGFNVVTVDGIDFLVDESIGQFINPETGEVAQGRGHTSGNYADFPILHSLVDDGYVALNKNSFKDYLRATSVAADKSYIDLIDLQTVLADEAIKIDYDHNQEELDGFLDGTRYMR
jgi:hypothetical protein